MKLVSLAAVFSIGCEGDYYEMVSHTTVNELFYQAKQTTIAN